MSLFDLIFPVSTVALAVACYACYKTNKPLREKAREEREALAKKAADEVKRLAREAYEADVAKAVNQALGVLFNEARDYSVQREEDRRRQARMGYGERPPVFGRESREVFHKVLRVGALEERVDRIEEGNKVRREQQRFVNNQLADIRSVIDTYV